MASFTLFKIMLPLLFLSLLSPKTVNGESEQWCIADEQAPDADLQAALDWACGKGGADCTQIQVNRSCYLPDTLRSHASYGFKQLLSEFKHRGGSCCFRAAALITELDPSKCSVISHNYSHPFCFVLIVLVMLYQE